MECAREPAGLLRGEKPVTGLPGRVDAPRRTNAGKPTLLPHIPTGHYVFPTPQVGFVTRLRP